MTLAGSSAYANVTPVLVTPLGVATNTPTTCTAGTGTGSCASYDGGTATTQNGYVYIYQINLSSSEEIDPTGFTEYASGSDYGAIYDFGAIVGSLQVTAGEASLANWTIGTQLTTTPPTGETMADSASVLNIYYYASAAQDITTAGTLFTITAVSLSPGGLNSSVFNYASQAGAITTDNRTANQGSVAAPTLTPEPGTISMLLFGLVGAVAFGRKRLARN